MNLSFYLVLKPISCTIQHPFMNLITAYPWSISVILGQQFFCALAGVPCEPSPKELLAKVKEKKTMRTVWTGLG